MIALDGYWEVKAEHMSQPRAQYTNGIYATANGTPVRILDFIIVRVGAQLVRRVLNGQFLFTPTSAQSANFSLDPISSASKSHFPLDKREDWLSLSVLSSRVIFLNKHFAKFAPFLVMGNSEPLGSPSLILRAIQRWTGILFSECSFCNSPIFFVTHEQARVKFQNQVALLFLSISSDCLSALIANTEYALVCLWRS